MVVGCGCVISECALFRGGLGIRISTNFRQQMFIIIIILLDVIVVDDSNNNAKSCSGSGKQQQQQQQGIRVEVTSMMTTMLVVGVRMK